jgi:hypothetical protein
MRISALTFWQSARWIVMPRPSGWPDLVPGHRRAALREADEDILDARHDDADRVALDDALARGRLEVTTGSSLTSSILSRCSTLLTT